MVATATKPTATKVNRSAWAHPRYVEADARWNDLKRRMGELDGQINDCQTQINNSCLTKQKNLEAEALAYGTDAPPPLALPDMTSLYKRRGVLQEAVELAGKRLREIEAEVSREIIAALKPEYVGIQRRIHAASLPLIEALEAEAAFRMEVVAGGTRLGTLVPCSFSNASRERLAFYEAELKEYYGVQLGTQTF